MGDESNTAAKQEANVPCMVAKLCPWTRDFFLGLLFKEK